MANLKETMKKLEETANWFTSQKELDIEQALNKAKESAGLFKESRARLKAIENEFEEIKKEIASEIEKS